MLISSEIQSHVDALAAARNSLERTLGAVQATCEHRFVSERPYLYGHFGKLDNPRRICLHCRLIEEGSHWSGGSTWSAVDYTKPILGNLEGRIVTTIDNDAFYKLRVSA